jgi:hypothetical protein
MNAKQARLTKFMNSDGLSRLSTTWIDQRPQRHLTKLVWWQQRWTQRSRSMNTSMTVFAAVVLTFLLLLELAGRIAA